jgi:hypothetical protein
MTRELRDSPRCSSRACLWPFLLLLLPPPFKLASVSPPVARAAWTFTSSPRFTAPCSSGRLNSACHRGRRRPRAAAAAEELHPPRLPREPRRGTATAAATAATAAAAATAATCQRRRPKGPLLPGPPLLRHLLLRLLLLWGPRATAHRCPPAACSCTAGARACGCPPRRRRRRDWRFGRACGGRSAWSPGRATKPTASSTSGPSKRW